ncbi:MAG: Hsp70 family protein, partial [Paludibacteraceae bacterium]|nr:Hsp70 family protein [Paludibacteraceae bacterium]
GIPAAPRGVPQIVVSFDIDANGILNVTALDKATNKEQKIRIESSSGLSKEEIERMKNEATANAAADQKERERVDKLNNADAMIFQVEKQLKEIGDKIPSNKRTPIETALSKLKDAHKSQDLAGIDASMKELENALHAASQDMYNAQQQAGGAQGGGFNGGNAGGQSGPNKDDITDVDFEEVK